MNCGSPSSFIAQFARSSTSFRRESGPRGATGLGQAGVWLVDVFTSVETGEAVTPASV